VSYYVETGGGDKKHAKITEHGGGGGDKARGGVGNVEGGEGHGTIGRPHMDGVKT